MKIQASPTRSRNSTRPNPYLVYCRSGRRSAAAMQQMKDAGFTNVTNLDGGIMGWQNAGLSVRSDGASEE
ncbi:MAG: rhodanese-like domain-containing protein [Bacteroidetes bacterium]|nr:rhodanese-like domain-containing protein [Bacteroidota bacterium]